MEIPKHLQDDPPTPVDHYERQVRQAEDVILAEAWGELIDAGEPLGALVLVEVQDKIVESISAGGLVMPGGLPLRVAVVISVGPGFWDGRNMCYVPLGLEVGDRVVLRGKAGIPVDPIRDLRLLPPGDTLFRIPAEVPVATEDDAVEFCDCDPAGRVVLVTGKCMYCEKSVQ